MRDPKEILKTYWGYDQFRPMQEEIVQRVLDGGDTIALLPTGGGKSVCYQVPALAMDGVCIVVSPLVSLMQDQVQRLDALGVPAVCLQSGMGYRAMREVLEAAQNGEYKLLYVSPERLQTYLFKDYVGQMEVSLLAVDEAHCISQWGHDFRPSYLQIAKVRELMPDVPALALTATATEQVRADIIAQLKMEDAVTYRTSFARTNIFYDVRYSEHKAGDVLAELKEDSSIVYCRSRRLTEQAAGELGLHGMQVAMYHAGMDRQSREAAQRAWMEDKKTTMVATTAFGMGIDKPDVRQVIHYDAPEYPEAYYQEAGRAGRDGLPSNATLFYNASDITRLEESADIQYPPTEYLRQVYQAVVEYLQIPIGTEPDKYYPFELTEFCRRFDLKAGRAVHALRLLEQQGLWTMTEAVYAPSTVMFTRDRYVLDRLEDNHTDLHYIATGLLRMYSSLFHYPTPIREFAVARQLRLQVEQVEAALRRLDKMDVLEYNKPGEGPQIFFHHYRVDSRHLLINSQRIARLRARHEERTKIMVHFLTQREVCRERILLEYFGEQPKQDCGHCDVCARKQTPVPSMGVLKKELLYLLELKGPQSMGMLAGNWPPAVRDAVTQALRELADELRVVVADGQVRLA